MAFKFCSQCFTKPSRGRRASGFTLVEVAVALAIFVFGALAIVRIFPPALGVIQNSESRQVATMIGRTTMAKLTAGINSVPDAIYDISPNATPGPEPTPQEPFITDASGQKQGIAVIGSPSKNVSLPAGPTETQFGNSALGHYKRIFGQRRVVQQSDDAGNPLFILTQFPYSAADPTRSIRVHTEANVVGVSIDRNGDLNFTDAHLSTSPDSPFSDTIVARPPDNMRDPDGVTYYVSYRWVAQLPGSSAPRVQGVTDEPIRLPRNGNWTASAPAPSGRVLQAINGNSVVPGAVQVRYRHVLTPPTTGYTFNPFLGYIGGLDAARAPRGSIVSVDYDVADWRWLVDDSAPGESPTPTPAPTPTNTTTPLRSVRLPVRNITDDPAYAVYGLLMGATSTSSSTTLRAGQWSSTGYTAPLFVPADSKEQAAMRKSGRVYYDTSAITAPTATGAQLGFRTRTVYRALDGWAHQLSVSARSYQPFFGGTLPRPPEHPREQWSEYILQVGGLQTYLYFHPSEVGKAIAVSFEYNDGTGYRRVTRGIFTTQDDVIDAPTNLPAEFLGAIRKVSRVELTGPDGNSVPVTAVFAVQGVGMTARTAWLDKERYKQQVVNGYRPME